MKYEEINALRKKGVSSPEMVMAAFAIGETLLAKMIITGVVDPAAPWVVQTPLPLGDEINCCVRSYANDGSHSCESWLKARPVLGTKYGVVTFIPRGLHLIVYNCWSVGDICLLPFGLFAEGQQLNPEMLDIAAASGEQPFTGLFRLDSYVEKGETDLPGWERWSVFTPSERLWEGGCRTLTGFFGPGEATCSWHNWEDFSRKEKSRLKELAEEQEREEVRLAQRAVEAEKVARNEKLAGEKTVAVERINKALATLALECGIGVYSYNLFVIRGLVIAQDRHNEIASILAHRAVKLHLEFQNQTALEDEVADILGILE
jgi:hypothetical protein